MSVTPSGPSIPPPEVCPLCGYDDDVTVSELSGEAEWLFRCPGHPRHHPEPYTWAVSHQVPFSGHEGICAELGLYEDLPLCLHTGEGWVEHGIVEYRYKTARPNQYRKLIDLYGHISRERKYYTASVPIARTLGQLAKEGVIAYRARLPATGLWSHNGTVGYWAPHEPGDGAYATWSSWAKSHDLDPGASGWILP